MSHEETARFDPFAAETLADPYPFYRALRAAPPARVAEGGYYLVSRYDDVRAAALDVETFSSKFVAFLLQTGEGGVALTPRPSEDVGPPDVLAIQDPPRHGPQRKRMTRCLGREAIDAMEPTIAAIVSPMLDGLIERGGGDLMAEVAFRVPVAVTLSLLAFPVADASWVKEKSDRAVELLSGIVTPGRLQELVLSALELLAYASDRWAEVSRGARATSAITGQLLEGVRAGEFGDAEAASMCMQLLIAGSDSTSSLIGSAARLLAERPELAEQLRKSPDLLPPFIEEVLRLEPPFLGHFRVTTRPTELGGAPLPAGAAVMLLWGSANRDPRAFESPDSLLLNRPNGKNHLGFGHGIHLCVGAQLARRQARLALGALLMRTKEISLSGGDLRYRPSAFVRTLDALPLRVRPA